MQTEICVYIHLCVCVSVHIQTEGSVAVNSVLQCICPATRCSHIALQNLKFWPQGYRNLFWNIYDCRILTTLTVFNPDYWGKNVIWAEFSIFLLNFVPKHSIANVNGDVRNHSRVRLVSFHGCCHRSRLELIILNYIVFCFLHNWASRNEALCSQDLHALKI